MPVATSRAAASPATAAATRSQIRPPKTVAPAMSEWRVEEEVVVQRVGEEVHSYEQEREHDQHGEDQPGPGTAYLVGELEAKNLPELHGATSGSGCSRRRPMCPAIVLK